MHRLLTLLLLCFAGTCARAQVSPTPTPLMGSGSIIVEIEEGSWFITISSSDTSETYGYVTENEFRKSPRAFAGYQTIKNQDRHNLSVVHQLINQKLALGWKLISTTPVKTSAVLDYNQLIQTETIYYYFSVPTKEKQPAAATDEATLVLASNGLQTPKQTMGASLFKKADGGYLLLIKEQVGGRWLENYRLDNAGIIAGDLPERIEKISLSTDGITFNLALANGAYEYTFSPSNNQEYYLTKVRFKSAEECGMVEYIMRSPNAGLTNFQAKYLDTPCTPGEKGRQHSEYVIMPQLSLRNFAPGAHKVQLKKLAAKPIY